jgi:hypothetical protein
MVVALARNGKRDDLRLSGNRHVETNGHFSGGVIVGDTKLPKRHEALKTQPISLYIVLSWNKDLVKLYLKLIYKYFAELWQPLMQFKLKTLQAQEIL